MGEGGFQENATYIDFIQRGENKASFFGINLWTTILFFCTDSLNRSVELVISSGSNYSLDPPPTGHIKSLQYPIMRHIRTHIILEVITLPTVKILSLYRTLIQACHYKELASSNIEQITTTVDDQDLSLEEMPMKRNNSYRMLDIEALAGNSEGGQDSIYSYPKLKPTHTQLQDHGYTTIGTKNE